MTAVSSMTGPRADNERMKAVMVVQLSRLQADTIAIVIHLSASSTSVSGESSSPAQCSSNGRGESELLDELINRVGGAGRKP